MKMGTTVNDWYTTLNTRGAFAQAAQKNTKKKMSIHQSQKGCHLQEHKRDVSWDLGFVVHLRSLVEIALGQVKVLAHAVTHLMCSAQRRYARHYMCKWID